MTWPAVGIGFDGDREARFEEYAAGFRTVFLRADQFLRFRAYLRGLLTPSPRKNVEAIAAAASAAIMVEADLAQALQHFVSHSPWDHRRLIAAARRRSQASREDAGAVWIVHDGAFPKKGLHSVGVHRQFARSLGKKINCQVGVFVAQVGPRGYHPLAAQLYLPGAWLREDGNAPLVPEEHRVPSTKAEIALQLLEGLRAEGEPARPVLPDGGYEDADFAEELAKKGFLVHPGDGRLVEAAAVGFERLRNDLGLDHFEGRTWNGWHHHVAMVVTATHFNAVESSPY